METVSVIIPTYNAEASLPALLEALRRQTASVDEIIVMDSGSQDNTCAIARDSSAVRLMQIPHLEFDHGGTRNAALQTTHTDFVWFLTQDAIPADERCLEELLKPFSDEKVAAAYARQIAGKNATRIEQLTRNWNYPNHSYTRTLQDLQEKGVRAIRLSNSCAVYRRTAYDRCGGFRYPLPTNEDMLMANRFLNEGYSVAYHADAHVAHWHHDDRHKIYKRYFDIGAFFVIAADELQVKNVQSDGLQFIAVISKQLMREGHYLSLFQFFLLCAARWRGNQKGRGFESLSLEQILCSTQNPAFWKRYWV